MCRTPSQLKFTLICAACAFALAGCIDKSDFVKYTYEPIPSEETTPFIPEEQPVPPAQDDDITHPGGSNGVTSPEDPENPTEDSKPAGGEVKEDEGPAIELVTPSSGDILGGYEVRLRGTLLEEDADIYFGSIQAPARIFVNSNVIRTTVPAGKKGCVDVTVNNGGETLKLENGFCYTEVPGVDDIFPKTAVAGTAVEVQITGTAFDETTHVYLSNGDTTLPLADFRIQNENLITGMIPMLEPGSIALTVINSSGHIEIPDALTLVPPLEVTQLTPDIIQTGDAPVIKITGSGMDDSTSVQIDGMNLRCSTVSAQELNCTAPDLAAGDYDILLYSEVQQLRVENAVHYYDDNGEPRIFDVRPASGSTQGGTQVTIRGVSLPTQGSALFDTAGATVLKRTADEWTVKTPKHNAGTVDVSIASVSRPNAFEFVQTASSELRLTGITPEHAVVDGQSRAVLKGSGFDQDTRVFFGPWESSEIEVSSQNSLTASIPPGSGTVPVRVVRGHETSDAINFTYDESVSIISVLPDQSVLTGKTQISLYGTGFTQGMTIKMGDETVETLYHNPGHLEFTAPAHKAGTETLRLICTDGSECGQFDFSWFNPTGINTSASGSPISGQLHVTVLTVDTAVPIAGATVYVGDDPQNRLTGITDEKGRVSFFDESLKNAQIVVACAPEHSCNTLQPVNATNVTLLLEDWHADDVDIDDPQPTPPPPPPSDGVINPIEIVVPYTPEQPYFTGTVGTFGKVELVSDPNLVRAGLVLQSAYSPYMMSHDKDDVYLILEEGAKYRMKARKGDVALALVCGLYDVNTTAFYPKFIGVKRHQFVTDAAEIVNHLECPLPLSQTQSVKFINTPLENFSQISASAYLFLGSEGYIGGFMNAGSPTDLTVLSNLPPLRDSISDANFAITVNAYYADGENIVSGASFNQYNVIPDGSTIEVGPTVSRPVFLTSDTTDILKTGFLAWKISNRELVDFYQLTVRLYTLGRSDLLYQFYLPGSATTAEFPTLYAWPEEEGYKQVVVQLTAYKSVRNGFDFNKFSTGDLRYNYIQSSATATLVITPEKINGTAQ